VSQPAAAHAVLIALRVTAAERLCRAERRAGRHGGGGAAAVRMPEPGAELVSWQAGRAADARPNTQLHGVLEGAVRIDGGLEYSTGQGGS
jgi:hypothetical protein